MTDVLIDTHVLAWSLIDVDQIGGEARTIMQSGVSLCIAPCSLHEIVLKVRKGKWDEMAPYALRLDALCVSYGFQIAPYTGRMAMLAGSMSWSHVDPFDRMIAATAIEMACPVISKDNAFDALTGFPGWKGRFWAEEHGPEPS